MSILFTTAFSTAFLCRIGAENYEMIWFRVLFNSRCKQGLGFLNIYQQIVMLLLSGLLPRNAWLNLVIFLRGSIFLIWWSLHFWLFKMWNNPLAVHTTIYIITIGIAGKFIIRFVSLLLRSWFLNKNTSLLPGSFWSFIP